MVPRRPTAGQRREHASHRTEIRSVAIVGQAALSFFHPWRDYTRFPSAPHQWNPSQEPRGGLSRRHIRQQASRLLIRQVASQNGQLQTGARRNHRSQAQLANGTSSGQVEDGPADARNTKAARAARLRPQPRQVIKQPRENIGPGIHLQLNAEPLQHIAAAQSRDEVVGQIVLVRQRHSPRIDPGFKRDSGVCQKPAEETSRLALHQVPSRLVVVIHARRV